MAAAMTIAAVATAKSIGTPKGEGLGGDAAERNEDVEFVGHGAQFGGHVPPRIDAFLRHAPMLDPVAGVAQPRDVEWAGVVPVMTAEAAAATALRCAAVLARSGAPQNSGTHGAGQAPADARTQNALAVVAHAARSGSGAGVAGASSPIASHSSDTPVCCAMRARIAVPGVTRAFS